jgi:hypothetical protein
MNVLVDKPASKLADIPAQLESRGIDNLDPGLRRGGK